MSLLLELLVFTFLCTIAASALRKVVSKIEQYQDLSIKVRVARQFTPQIIRTEFQRSLHERAVKTFPYRKHKH